MIIGVVAERTPQAVRNVLARLARDPGPDRIIAELRLDTLESPDPDLVHEAPVPVIATCRRPRDGGEYSGDEGTRESLLRRAWEAGARWVDVETDVLADWSWARGQRILASFHDFTGMPESLEDLVTQSLELGAAQVKVAVRVTNLVELLRLTRVADAARGRVVAFGLGPVGIPSRLLFRRFQNPWVYARVLGEDPRPGQLAPGLPSLDSLVGHEFPDASLPEPVAVFGVLSDRALDSIGPLAWNRVFRRLQVPAIYLPFSTPGITGLREVCHRLGVRGLSVTTPFKESVLELVDDMHPLVEAVGATNTLQFQGGRVVAHNTDYRGVFDPVERALREQGEVGLPPRALVLGAGGAARAGACALKNLGLDVRIWSRSRDRAEQAAAQIGVEVGTPSHCRESHVIVNATLAGGPRDPEGIPVESDHLQSDHIVFEMNQVVGDTPLVREAKARGAFVIRGEEMYAVQAIHQLQLFWAGLKSVETELREAVAWSMACRASS